MVTNKDSTGKSPESSEDYVKTAKELKGMNELTLAMEVCDKGLKKQPDNSNIYILKSQVQIAQFKKEKNSHVLKEALQNLEKALKLNPHSYIARILASQICLKGKAYKKAKALLANVLKTFPDDEKANSMMAVISKKEKKKAEAAKPDKIKAAPAKKASEPDKIEDEVIVQPSYEDSAEDDKETMSDTHPEDDNWIIDEKLVIDGAGDDDDKIHLELLSEKLTMFGRLKGLEAIFLVDNHGQLFKSINKNEHDENVIPSLVFNLYKASVTGARRIGYGSFQRGTLVTPIGTIIIANAFYATLAVIVDNEANIGPVESRIQRYLDEVAQ